MEKTYKIDKLLLPMKELDGTDLHLTCGETPKYRIRADMQVIKDQPVLTTDSITELLSEIVSPEQWQHFLKDHDFDFAHSIPGFARFRTNLLFQRNGLGAVFRMIPEKMMSFEDLGLPNSVLQFVEIGSGLVLVTGPTGSGKTTTLYAALSEINTSEDKIITIEDPVEYQLPGVVQIPVNEKKGLTFARGLRSILRHDPDKILVGEIRDSETAQIAVQSALTGHLVFTTVHANTAFDVISRFTNMGVEPYNFVSSLNCILAQRLVRGICPNCKSAIQVTRQQLEAAAIDYDEAMKAGATFFEGKGCQECNGTGYKGRQAITEFLDLTDRIREMILDRRPNSELNRAAREEGMSTLRQSAVKKVLAGVTTIREINRVTFVER
jgi:pilus retraction protein PilT